MSTLLQIQSSLAGADGQSSQLASRLAAQWLAVHPEGKVITRNLAAEPVPHLTAEDFRAFGIEPHLRSPGQQAFVGLSDQLIAELREADVVVFAVPMYNFGIPSTLRAYFDHVARAGVTFRYTADGPEGLIKGKKAYAVITRGGAYPEALDTQTPYLRQFLGFVGIVDLQFVYAESLALGEEPREKSLAAARHTIAKLLPTPQAALPY